MKKIPGTKLAVMDGEIYSLSHHHIRKPGKHDVFAYYDTDGKKRSATRAKLIWCADNGVEPWKVPEGYSFHLCDGEAVCETFSDRMSRVRKHPIATASWEDYDFIERFSHACKEHLKGDSTARVRIFQMLNSKREELIEHAKRTEGGGGREKGHRPGRPSHPRRLRRDRQRPTRHPFASGEHEEPHRVVYQKCENEEKTIIKTINQ